ncbi:MAG TPA: META domain-containing protein [Ktedonobacterales bacterium]|nr:META domain-containing protein [Ktedonobacterales bacterium]
MTAADLENTNWKLASYFDGTALRGLPSGAEVTLTFQDGAAGGKSACNRYRSSVTIGDGTLKFGMVMGTRMACPPPLMEIESIFLRMLESVTAWQINDDTLEMRNGAGQILLSFARG